MTDIHIVLRKILDTAEIGIEACAAALNLSGQVLAEILAGQRGIPDSILPLVAAVLGVKESVLTSSVRESRGPDVVPAIWYKLRAGGLGEVDREYILAIRELAYFEHELEHVTDSRSVGWKGLFEELRRETNPQDSPTEQGRQAARLFRRSRGLDQGATGIGELFRGHLRNIGILVIESSAPDSVIEGCSFYVGPSGFERPSIFANSFRTTWFRRNRILMHELAHAIFDVESTIATLDFAAGAASTDDLQEQRADAFAQEALVPREVLRNVAQRERVRWEDLDPKGLAALMAATHVEQRLLAKALLDAELVSGDVAKVLESCDVAEELRRVSPHALSTEEYLRLHGVEEAGVKGRTTTTAPRKMLLPPRYVGGVVGAYQAREISLGKAARMLMIEEREFIDRFPAEQLAYAD